MGTRVYRMLSSQSLPRQDIPWQCSSLSYHKCNFDASYDFHTNLSMAASLETSISPFEAEAKILLECNKHGVWV